MKYNSYLSPKACSQDIQVGRGESVRKLPNFGYTFTIIVVKQRISSYPKIYTNYEK